MSIKSSDLRERAEDLRFYLVSLCVFAKVEVG